MRVTPCARDPDRNSDGEHHQAVRRPAEQRDASHFLRDLRLKRINGAECRAHRRRADADRDRCRGVVPQSPCHEQEHWHERDDLFPHVLERAGRCERDRHDRNDQRRSGAQRRDEIFGAVTECPRLVHDGQRAANQEHEEHN